MPSERTYLNPILYTDYSDPDVIRVGEDYYMTASSFSNAPGLPVLHSKNLVSWEILGYALPAIPEFYYREPLHGCGVWAPAIRYHEGYYYIFFPMPDEGIYSVRTKDPAGKWEKPVKILDAAGYIDPCPLWDEGRLYMVCAVAKSRMGFQNVLYMFELDPATLRIISGPVKVYEGGDANPVTEGPKLYKRDGYYWIFAPAGGVKTGWQLAMRSRSIYGPYEARVVMRQGTTGINGPHQGAWVSDTQGGDWFVHFQDVFAAGRIVHLQPMSWRGGWPVIGAAQYGEDCGQPVCCHACPPGEDVAQKEYGFTDDRGDIAPVWQWNANPGPDFYAGEGGRIALNAVPFDSLRPLSDLPNLLLRKWEAPEFEARITMTTDELREGESVGIINLGIRSYALTATKVPEGLLIKTVRDIQHFDRGAIYTEELSDNSEIIPDTGEITWKIAIRAVNDVTATSDKPEIGYGDEKKVLRPQEKVELSVVSGGEEKIIFGGLAEAGRWVGCKYGCFCTRRENVKKLTYFGRSFLTIFVAFNKKM